MPDPDALQVVLTTCTLLALWFGWVKIIGPVVRGGWSWAMDLWTIVRGRRARIDRVTGTKHEAVPSLVDALVQIRDVQGVQGKSIEKLTTVLTEMANQKATLAEHGRELVGLRTDVTALQKATEERTEIRRESAAMFEAVAKRDSDVIDVQTEP